MASKNILISDETVARGARGTFATAYSSGAPLFSTRDDPLRHP